MNLLVVCVAVILVYNAQAGSQYYPKESYVSFPDGVCNPPPSCVFPFSYNGIIFDGCTDYVSSTGPWCSHHETYSYSWSYCECEEKGLCVKQARMAASYAYSYTDSELEPSYAPAYSFSQVTSMPTVIRAIIKDNYISCFGFDENSCSDWNNASSAFPFHYRLSHHEMITRIDLHDNGYDSPLHAVTFFTNRASFPIGINKNSAYYTTSFGDGDSPIFHVERYLDVSSLAGSSNRYLRFYLACEGINEYSRYESVFNDTMKALKAGASNVITLAEQYTSGLLPSFYSKGCEIYKESAFTSYEHSCQLHFILEQLRLYKNTVGDLYNHSPRSLLRISKYNRQILLTEVNRASQFRDILNSIRVVEKDVEGTTKAVVESANATGDYFEKLATFDKNIAQADVDFFTTRLQSLKSGTTSTITDIQTRLERMFRNAVTLAGADMAETAARLAVAIASNFNPLKLIFGGPDLVTMMELMAEFANKAATFAKALTLSNKISSFMNKLQDITNNFSENRAQLVQLRHLVDEFADASTAGQLSMANQFVSGYGDYSPKVTMQDLTYAIELLQGVIEIGCGIIHDSSSAIGSITKSSYENTRQDCLYLPPLISQLGSYYEDTYSIQFDLVDAMTNIVRGNIAESMTDVFQNIVDDDEYDVSTAAIGTAMVQINFQKTAIASCNLIEYQQGGFRPLDCQETYVQESSIGRIIAYEGNVGVSEKEKFAFMPTTAPSEPHTPHINVTQLIEDANNNEYGGINFHLPMNDLQWMKKYHWIPNDYQYSYNKEYSYRIKLIEAFIPGLEYDCEGTCNGPTSCVFPFQYDGVTYNECTNVNAGSAYWCAHHSVYRSGSWSYCTCSQSKSDYEIGIDMLSSYPTRLFPQEEPPQYSIPSKMFRFEQSVGRTCQTTKDFEVRMDTSSMTIQPSRTVCMQSRGHARTDSDGLLPSVFSGWTLRLRNTEPGCRFRAPIDTLGYHPLISFWVEYEEVALASPNGNIYECWPPGSRCQPWEFCEDGILSYSCAVGG